MNDYTFTIPAGQVDLIRVGLETLIQQAGELHARLAYQAQNQPKPADETPVE